MADSETGVDRSVVQDNGEIWAADKRDLAQKLSKYYGVDDVRFSNEHVSADDKVYYDAIVRGDIDDETLVKADLTPLGHPPSGAIGVVADELPPAEAVWEADS